MPPRLPTRWVTLVIQHRFGLQALFEARPVGADLVREKRFLKGVFLCISPWMMTLLVALFATGALIILAA
jgi:hypothetical protein